MALNKILIANRGEIAVRIIRACREMGIKTVAVFSDADVDALHVKHADEAVNIGPALSRKSYLNMDRIIEAATDKNVDAIHPGYGFLSENAAFAQACVDNNRVFIGPSAACIATAGNKSAARKKLMGLGIPIIPGSEDILASPEAALDVAADVGYPVILKASGGGGGRGKSGRQQSGPLSRKIYRKAPAYRNSAHWGSFRQLCSPGRKRMQHPDTIPETD